MPTTTEPAADVAALRARVVEAARRGPQPLTPSQLARAQNLAADILAVYIRHGIPTLVVEAVTSISAAAIDAVRLQKERA